MTKRLTREYMEAWAHEVSFKINGYVATIGQPNGTRIVPCPRYACDIHLLMTGEVHIHNYRWALLHETNLHVDRVLSMKPKDI